MTRYNLADSIYGKAEIDCSAGIVNLWLGANVMLEYTYEEAIDFLTQNEVTARKEFEGVKEDLAFVRDQIITCEVAMTRIFNWDVRKKRILLTLVKTVNFIHKQHSSTASGRRLASLIDRAPDVLDPRKYGRNLKK